MVRTTSLLFLTFIAAVAISQNPPTLQWMNNITHPQLFNGNKPLSICLVNDGLVYTGNFSGSYRDTERGFFVRKYNTGGNLIWEYFDLGEQIEHFLAIDATCDEDGNTYVSTERNRIWKLSSNGDSLWMKGASFTYNGTFYPEQGNYLNFKNGKVEACSWHGLVDYDQNGNFTDILYEEQKMRDPSYDGFGNTYFIGDYVPIIDHERRIVKLDKNYNKVWKIVLGPEPKLFEPWPMEGIDVDIYGNVFLLSAYDTISKLTKYDTDGNLLWKINLPASSRHRDPYNNSRVAESVCADREGNVFVAGDVSDTSGVTFVICKFSSAGNLIWKFEWKEPDKNFVRMYATGIINAGRDLYIAGYKSTLEQYRPAGFLMKLSDPGNLSGVKEQELVSDSWQLYPNPSNGHMFAHSKQNLTQNDKISFDMTTATGACISAPVQQQDPQTWSIDLSCIPEGCYFLRVKNGDDITVKRILAVK